MKKIKNENFFSVHGWMLNELNLKGNELMVYAIIYGFSQDGESWFTGSCQYLCEFIGATKPTVLKAIQSLNDKGLIFKEVINVNGLTFNRYKVTLLGVKKFNEGGKETLPNNISNNISNNINYIKDCEKKHKYGTYGNVLLTDEDVEKLKKEFPTDYQERIERVSEYCASKGKTYSNYLATIRNWARKERKTGRNGILLKTNRIDDLDNVF